MHFKYTGNNLVLSALIFICCVSTISSAEVEIALGERGNQDITINHLAPEQSCTIIYATDGNTVLAGNNEDYINTNSIIWFVAPEEGKLGRVYFGFDTLWPQGGMNEEGLFFDGATAGNMVRPYDSTKLEHGHERGLIFKIMEECSSVDEALEYFDKYDCSGTWNGHNLIGDRFGNSAIVEPRAIIKKNGNYQIATNFYQSITNPKDKGDFRYDIAKDKFEATDKITVDLFRNILNVTHWEEYGEGMTTTLYSNICDLKAGDIYLYNFHNYDDVVVFNLKEELEKSTHFYRISSLFPYKPWAQQRFERARAREMIFDRVVKNGLGGPDGALALIEELSSPDNPLSKYAGKSEGSLNSLGYRLLHANNIERAVEVFEYVVSQYPQSANAYDSLGEALLKAGRKEMAIANYTKSLGINPDNENARKILEELE